MDEVDRCPSHSFISFMKSHCAECKNPMRTVHCNNCTLWVPTRNGTVETGWENCHFYYNYKIQFNQYYAYKLLDCDSGPGACVQMCDNSIRPIDRLWTPQMMCITAVLCIGPPRLMEDYCLSGCWGEHAISQSHVWCCGVAALNVNVNGWFN